MLVGRCYSVLSGHKLQGKSKEGMYLVQERGFLPIEVAAENGFDDPVVGAGCRAYAYSDVDFPLRRDVEVGDYEYLLLLVMERIEGAQSAVVCVVFDTATDLAVKVEA